jgi:hypothetical protein
MFNTRSPQLHFHSKVPLLALIALLTVMGCKKEEDPPAPPPAPPVVQLNPGPCDQDLPLAMDAAWDAAKAIDVCKTATDAQDWGLIAATLIRANDQVIPPSVQFGIMQTFGTNNSAQRGDRMLVISTGSARTPTQSGYCGTSCIMTGSTVSLAGLPIDVPGCTPASNIYDDVGLKLELRVPSGATGFSVDHKLFTFDHPTFACTAFNDQFVVLVDPAPTGALNGNVAFDRNNVPLGANCEFIIPGAPQTHFAGTGFGPTSSEAGVTGWLRTNVPVSGGSEITVRLILYDVGDQALNTTVLLDNFRWLSGSATLGTVVL